MLKREREWCVESNGKLPHLFIPSKTTNLVPEFAVEDLPLDRTAILVPLFAVKDLPLGRTLCDDHTIVQTVFILILWFGFIIFGKRHAELMTQYYMHVASV